MLYIFLIAVSLALDAFAVSITSGLTVKGFNIRHSLLMGVYFGAFQFIMPLLGWLLGSTVSHYVSRFGPWISFILLAFIGGRMVYSALRDNDDEAGETSLTHRRLLLLAVATSIDAFAVGVSFAFMRINIWGACTVIGVVAFAMSIIGGQIGGRLSGVFQKRAEVIGGLVLIGIGIKILLEGIL
ncbi:MAG: manganese efflux pump [Oscillospiraceae bacterium]|nr:manganese efflux pump [Oscillospiraceae bacterium]